MSPEAKCPNCGSQKLFHDDEMEGLEEGLVVCLDCRMEVVINDVVGELLQTPVPKEDSDTLPE